YRRAREERRMPTMVAFMHTMLLGVAYLFLRLEGQAWQRAGTHYGPWFRHITRRQWGAADPLRHTLQMAWLALFRAAQAPRGPGLLRRTARWLVRQVSHARSLLFAALGSVPGRLQASGTLRAVAHRAS